LTLQGASGNLLKLRSSISPGQWAINALGSSSVSYVDVKDSNATGSVIYPSSSVNSGNNTNWKFPFTPTISVAGTYTLSVVGSNLQLSDGTHIFTQSVSGTSNITITNSSGSATTVAIDYNSLVTNGFTGTITFTGSGLDTLCLTDGSGITQNFTYTNPHDGSVQLGSLLINYTGLLPITSSITASDVTLTYADSTNKTITITDAGGGQTTVTSDSGETTTFANPSTTLTINAGTAPSSETVNLASLAASYAAAVTINAD